MSTSAADVQHLNTFNSIFASVFEPTNEWNNETEGVERKLSKWKNFTFKNIKLKKHVCFYTYFILYFI